MADDSTRARVVAVVEDPEESMSLRSQAASLLAQAPVRENELGGGEALREALDGLEPDDREALADATAPELLAVLSNEGAEPQAMRAVAALGTLRPLTSAATRERIDDAALAWMLEDFGRRSGADGELVPIFASTPERTAALLPALTPHRSSSQLVTIALQVAERGTPETREQAARRIVAVSREYESDAFAAWLRERLETALASRGEDLSTPENRSRLDRAVPVNVEHFVAMGIQALHVLRSVPDARSRLEELASDEETAETVREAAQRALRDDP